MRLSIIIRTLNRLEYLVRTIISIDKKSGMNKNSYEIILVDQGSEDGTVEWIKSIIANRYYPVKAVFLGKNVGDGLGMAEGIRLVSEDSEFIAQHDDDIEISSGAYYRKLIFTYQFLEENGFNICALGGSHRQGINLSSAPFRFAVKRFKQLSLPEKNIPEVGSISLVNTAWCTASFIFRKKFLEIPFGKGMCNSFCGEWFDRGYRNFICANLKFWHIDSSDSGGEFVQKQHDKFPNYEYVFKHYRNFVRKKRR